jgi:hypothetical protein
MSAEDNKAVVGRWFTEFWGTEYNPDVIDELAAHDIRFEYSMHTPCKGRDEVRAAEFRAAFPDLGFEGTADLVAEGRLRGRPVGGWRDPHRPSVRRPSGRFASRRVRQEDALHRHHGAACEGRAHRRGTRT